MVVQLHSGRGEELGRLGQGEPQIITAPDEITALHLAAAGWFAGHGYGPEAVRHAQAAGDWGLAARLLADRWPGLYLDGQTATVHGLLARFPAGARPADAELAAVAAGDELAPLARSAR